MSLGFKRLNRTNWQARHTAGSSFCVESLMNRHKNKNKLELVAEQVHARRIVVRLDVATVSLSLWPYTRPAACVRRLTFTSRHIDTRRVVTYINRSSGEKVCGLCLAETA